MYKLDYFLNFKEGDNITITADFINNVESLREYIEAISDYSQQRKKEINTLNENIEIMHKYIKILLKEID